jgi:hypothetical protein
MLLIPWDLFYLLFCMLLNVIETYSSYLTRNSYSPKKKKSHKKGHLKILGGCLYEHKYDYHSDEQS